MSIQSNRIEAILKGIPDEPGIYKFSDQTGVIIYIGKARSLKKRVGSYFTNSLQLSGKTRVLVSNIWEISFTVTLTESDALLLENNLIKQYQPRYNILLKDDKTFPWICIKNERFPRIFATRDYQTDGAEYFGPYTSVKLMRSLLDLIRKLFTYRTCSFNLSEKTIQSGKFKVCLEYHLGNCKGPCQGYQTEDEYTQVIGQVRMILKGNLNALNSSLKEMMKSYSDNYEFEKAQLVKEKLEILERHQARSAIVNPSCSNVDIFSIAHDSVSGYANYIKVVDGCIVQTHSVELKKKLEETQEELLSYAIVEIRERLKSPSPEVIVPFLPEFSLPNAVFTVPQKGDKKKLLDLSERNARFFMAEMEKRRSLTDPERHTRRVMEAVMKELRLPELPVRIECIDNSNTQGAQPVSSVVVFENGKPLAKEYRHFNIQTVVGPDDFASMREVVSRRYSRMIAEEKPLPQLLVIDGGKGQLSAALSSLEELGLRGKIAIISIAKKLEEIYFPDDPYPLHLPKTGETLRLIQRLRDEAHRFGIAHHRKKRDKASLASELSEIPGIGKSTAEKLLKHFKSVKKIREAKPEELEQVVGASKAATILSFFSNNAICSGTVNNQKSM